MKLKLLWREKNTGEKGQWKVRRLEVIDIKTYCIASN